MKDEPPILTKSNEVSNIKPGGAYRTPPAVLHL